jgi:hypothetical protein
MASFTLRSVLIFIPGVIITFFFYLNTYDRKSDQAPQLLPWYLVALAIQLIHFTEEYSTDFVTRLPAIFGQAPYPLDYFVAFNMIAYSIFIIGGIALYLKAKAFLIIPLFFILIGVFFNGVAHVFLSIYVGGYFPGLYTALIYVGLGPFLILKIRSHVHLTQSTF